MVKSVDFVSRLREFDVFHENSFLGPLWSGALFRKTKRLGFRWKPLGNRWKNSRFLVANKVDFSGGRILPPLGLGFRVLGCRVRV